MDLGSDADFRQVFLQLIAVWRANHVEMIDRSGPSGFAWNRYARRHRCKQLVVAARTEYIRCGSYQSIFGSPLPRRCRSHPNFVWMPSSALLLMPAPGIFFVAVFGNPAKECGAKEVPVMNGVSH